jgi:hypothetical protein
MRRPGGVESLTQCQTTYAVCAFLARPVVLAGVASVASDQLLPSQNSATAALAGLSSGVVELPMLPTATQLAADMHDTW